MSILESFYINFFLGLTHLFLVLKFRFKKLLYKLKYFFRIKRKEDSYLAFIKIGIVLSVGATILSYIKERMTFDKLVAKIDERLMVKRFWLVGKAYKKALEAK